MRQFQKKCNTRNWKISLILPWNLLEKGFRSNKLAFLTSFSENLRSRVHSLILSLRYSLRGLSVLLLMYTWALFGFLCFLQNVIWTEKKKKHCRIIKKTLKILSNQRSKGDPRDAFCCIDAYTTFRLQFPAASTTYKHGRRGHRHPAFLPHSSDPSRLIFSLFHLCWVESDAKLYISILYLAQVRKKMTGRLENECVFFKSCIQDQYLSTWWMSWSLVLGSVS